MAKKTRHSRSVPVAIAPTDERETVSISKIKNGYLIEKSGSKRGKWYSHREYSATKPVVAATVAKEPAAKSHRHARAPRAPVPMREVGFLKGQQ